MVLEKVKFWVLCLMNQISTKPRNLYPFTGKIINNGQKIILACRLFDYFTVIIVLIKK